MNRRGLINQLVNHIENLMDNPLNGEEYVKLGRMRLDALDMLINVERTPEDKLRE